ncbi:DUF3857 domain-containing protein [Ferruginibacter sp.]
MKTVFSVTGLMLVLALHTKAQSPSIKWDPNPVPHKVKAVYNAESAVILSDMRMQEYVQEDKKGLMIITTTKKLVKVMDDKGVEMFNKIYLPVYNGSELIEVKARTILPSGKIVNLPAEKILDVEEEGRAYKKFALEGVEKGSEIEYYYQVKRPSSFFGLEIFQSSTTPYEEADFILVTPDYLSFTVKGYNGFSVSRDTVIGAKRVTTATCKDILAIDDEKYGNKDAHAKNVQYKFSYNLSKDKNVRVFTWNELAKNVYNGYTSYTDKEAKAVEGFLKQVNIPATASEEQKIITLEDYIKTNINSDKEGIGEDADKIEKIVKTKVSSNDGLNKLFIICMDKLGINWQIVFPSKRDDIPLDEELENYRLIDEMLFYFPSTGHFLEPVNSSYRYPYFNPFWANTKGLFLQGTTIGNFKTALASFNDIPIQPIEESAHNMEVSLKFNSDMDSLELHSKQILLGYGATIYRPAYNFIAKDKLEDLSKDIIKSVAKSDNIKNIKVQNTAFTDGFYKKPLTIEADIVSADLLEIAGKRILVKLGEVIGPQEQMYQEKARQLPISMQYPHVLDRDITFTIPAGYQVKNLNDLAMNITDKEMGKETMGFVSTYKIEGNDLKIKVHEFYSVTDYPISMFDEFKKIINASADFNKVVLVLEKK